jgi:hypothetical protein
LDLLGQDIVPAVMHVGKDSDFHGPSGGGSALVSFSTVLNMSSPLNGPTQRKLLSSALGFGFDR